MITATLAFAGVAALINLTPGLDTLLVVRTSVAHGRTGGYAAALGIITGCLAWGLATAVGLTALLTASHLAYDALRIAGAGYLAWLGITALWRSRQQGRRHDGELEPADKAADSSSDSSRGRLAAFRAGLATNLLNPKAGVFYMSLIPQFIPHGAAVFSATLLLTAIDVVELAIWFAVLSRAASALGERARRRSFRRRMEQISGITFLGFAANLVLADHA
ncbi:LysE family translocator [Streptomyces sp. NPDC048595]|uniref:LysE family translocator n=1 Tax=Streptomyces sp. NPDC048595 TaxID=3365576 RepID=UPI0037139F63